MAQSKPINLYTEAEVKEIARRACDLTMHLERGNQWIDVNRLFDRMGSETFDPTEATEVEHDGNLLELQEGDRLTVVVEMAE